MVTSGTASGKAPDSSPSALLGLVDGRADRLQKVGCHEPVPMPLWWRRGGGSFHASALRLCVAASCFAPDLGSRRRQRGGFRAGGAAIIRSCSGSSSSKPRSSAACSMASSNAGTFPERVRSLGKVPPRERKWRPDDGSPDSLPGGAAPGTDAGQALQDGTTCQNGMVGTPPNCRCPENSELLGGNCVHYTASACSKGLASDALPQACQGVEEKLSCTMRQDGMKDCCCLTYDKF